MGKLHDFASEVTYCVEWGVKLYSNPIDSRPRLLQMSRFADRHFAVHYAYRGPPTFDCSRLTSDINVVGRTRSLPCLLSCV